MFRKFALTFALILSLPVLIRAKEVQWTGQMIEVKIGKGKTTQIICPANIKNIVTSLDQIQLSVEVYRNILYLQPLYAPAGNLFINTTDGTAYTFHLQTVDPAQADTTLKIKIPENKVSLDVKQDKTLLHYMKQLMSGVAQKKVGISSSDRVIYHDKNLKITLQKTYDWALYSGWVCAAENVSKGAIVVPIQRVSIPHLRAIACDTETLQPKEITRVYILLGQ